MINQNGIIVKSPGRINLIGEHIDYNGGHVLPASIDRKVTMWFRKKDNSLCRVNSEDEGAFTFDINKPLQISDTHWENYVLGIVFAAFLKLIIPVIVVLPGIIAYVMNLDPETGTLNMGLLSSEGFLGTAGNVANDNAAPWLIKNFIPVGLKGLILAALAAAIVSSLASMINSTSTIFTMDIYKSMLNKNANDKQMVKVGRLTGLVALIIAMLIAPQLGSLGQVFQFIQEYTGVVSPGILAVFLMGLFYKKATNNAAIWGVILSIPIAMYFKVAPNGWSDAALFVNLPFMHQMMLTCIGTILVIAGISKLEGNQDDPKGIVLSKQLFATDKTFNVGAFGVLLITALLYALFW